MNKELEDKTLSQNYTVLSIEETSPPEGMVKGKWFRYVIGHGRSRIEGIRKGTLKSVTEHAETFASNLNIRSTFGYSTNIYRKQKQ